MLYRRKAVAGQRQVVQVFAIRFIGRMWQFLPIRWGLSATLFTILLLLPCYLLSFCVPTNYNLKTVFLIFLHHDQYCTLGQISSATTTCVLSTWFVLLELMICFFCVVCSEGLFMLLCKLRLQISQWLRPGQCQMFGQKPDGLDLVRLWPTMKQFQIGVLQPPDRVKDRQLVVKIIIDFLTSRVNVKNIDITVKLSVVDIIKIIINKMIKMMNVILWDDHVWLIWGLPFKSSRHPARILIQFWPCRSIRNRWPC